MRNRVVMLLSNGFSPDTRVLQEARSLVTHGYEVTIYAWDRENKFIKNEVLEGIRIRRIKIKSSYNRGNSQIGAFLAVYVALFFRILFKPYDIFHCHDFDMLPIGFLLAKIKGSKLIYDSHECYVDMLINVSVSIKNTLSVFENYMLKRVDAVITVGEILGEHFRQLGAKKVEIIGNWKSPKEFAIDKELLRSKRKELGFDQEFIISYIGFMNNDRKLLELIHCVKERNDNCACVIGGLGTMSGRIKSEMNGSKKLRWLGYVAHAQVPLYTSLSDIVFEFLNTEVLNTKYCATNKFFEALAAGKPFLALDLGEIGKIIREEKCGVLIPSLNTRDINNGIDEIKRNYTVLSQNSRDSGLSKYNWEIAENRLFNLYANILIND